MPIHPRPPVWVYRLALWVVVSPKMRWLFPAEWWEDERSKWETAEKPLRRERDGRELWTVWSWITAKETRQSTRIVAVFTAPLEEVRVTLRRRDANENLDYGVTHKADRVKIEFSEYPFEEGDSIDIQAISEDPMARLRIVAGP